jgi:predicted Zn-dependent protease
MQSHLPTPVVKFLTSFSFLLFAAISMFWVLWAYPPTKNYERLQIFQRNDADKKPAAMPMAQKAAPAAKRQISIQEDPIAAPTPTTAVAGTPLGKEGAKGGVAGKDAAGEDKKTMTPEHREQLESAMKLVDTGKPTEAVPILTKLLAEDPNNEMALVELGMIHLLDFKDAASSLPFLEKALRVNPTNQVVMTEVLGAYEEMGQPDGGMAFLQQLHEEQPQNKELAYGIGKSYIEMGESSKALPFLADAAKDGTNSQAVEKYGQALIANGSPEEGLDVIRTLVDKAVEKQKNGDYASEPDQGAEKIAMARLKVAMALHDQKMPEYEQELAEAKKLLKTDEAFGAVLEKLRRDTFL